MNLLFSTIVLLSCGVALGLPQDFEFLNDLSSSLSKQERSLSEEGLAELYAEEIDGGDDADDADDGEGAIEGFEAASDSEENTPTVKDDPNFDVANATAQLIAALTKRGSDGSDVLNILAPLSNKQRLELLAKYNNGTGDLLKAIQTKFSGTFETLLLALMQTPSVFVTTELYDGLRGVGRREETLIDILCVMTPDEVSKVALEFRNAYKRSLTEYVISTTSGDFRTLMSFVLESEFRDKTTEADPDLAKKQAIELFNAGEGRSGTDVKTFIQILGSASFAQLKETFAQYRANTHKTISQSIRTETSGNTRDGLLAIVGKAQNLPQYYAQRLSLGSDAVMKRIFTMRSEIDLGNIKDEYEKLYQRTLRSDVDKKSGDFKKALLLLLGE